MNCFTLLVRQSMSEKAAMRPSVREKVDTAIVSLKGSLTNTGVALRTASP